MTATDALSALEVMLTYRLPSPEPQRPSERFTVVPCSCGLILPVCSWWEVRDNETGKRPEMWRWSMYDKVSMQAKADELNAADYRGREVY